MKKEQIELLIKNSTLSEEEMIAMNIIQMPKMRPILVISLHELEVKEYTNNCFYAEVSRAEMTRKLIEKAMQEPEEIFQTPCDEHRVHDHRISVSLSQEMYQELKKVLCKKAKETNGDIRLTKAEFVRRCIVCYLKEIRKREKEIKDVVAIYYDP